MRDHTRWGLKSIEWGDHGRDASFLLTGSELEAAEQWLARQSGKRPEPTALHNELVFVSRRNSVRRLRRTRAFTSVALAIVSVLAVTALVLRNQAVNESQIATSRQLGADSLLELSSDPQLSLLLGVQAARVRHTPEALDSLRRALPANHLLRTLQQDRQPVDSAVLSPDGTLVAAASRNYVVRVWKTNGHLMRVLRGHSANVNGLTFDATSRKVLTWAEDGTARLWNVDGNKPPIVMQEGDYRVIHASISPDGRLVATSTFLHSSPRIWDATSGKVLFSLGKITDTVPDIEFSPDSRRIATGSVNGTVSIWSAATGARTATLKVATGQNSTGQVDVNEALFSPSGRYLLTSTSDATGARAQSQVWDLNTLHPETPPLTGDVSRWSPDGRFVITTATGDARIWNAHSGRLQQTLHGPDPIAGPALLSSDGGSGAPVYAITGNQDGTADVWNPADGTIVQTLAGTQGAVTPAAFWPDASRVLTFGSDGSTRIWSTGAVVPQPAPNAPSVQSAARLLGGAANVARSSYLLEPDPLTPLAAIYQVTSSGVSTNSATVIDTRTGTRASTFKFPSGSSVSPSIAPGYVSFDARGRVMLVMGNGRAQIRAARSGRLLHTLSGVGSLAANGAVSPDGKLVAAADNEDRIGIWDVATGRHLVSFYRHHPQADVATAITLKFSPDSTLVLSADQSGVTFIWPARTGHILNEIHGPGPPTKLMYNQVMSGAISPNDQLAVTTSGWDNDAHVYRVGYPGELIALRGHFDGIDDATFSPDSTLIATTAGHSFCTGSFVGPTCDNSTRVWDTQQASPLLSLPNDGRTRVDFSADGSSLVINAPLEYDVSSERLAEAAFPYETLACIVCGGFDRLIPLAVHAEVRQLTPEERARFNTG